MPQQEEERNGAPVQPYQVFCAKAPGSGYTWADGDASQAPAHTSATPASSAVKSLFAQAGWDREHAGTPDWNPAAALISPGQKVVLKPNWVLHTNDSGAGMDCLVTHTSVIEAVLRFVSKAQPASIVVGDAPVQGCDFEALLSVAGVRAMQKRLHDDGIAAEVRDFRLERLDGRRLGSRVVPTSRLREDYVLFDLGSESALEPVTGGSEFRVTMYNPDVLQQTHAPGRHQYLVAREMIEADVVFNLPKLKTHKKACITGALKNLVGINGHKDYLPHHRKGGSERGGDCYPGGSRFKALAESALDTANRAQDDRSKRLYGRLANYSVRVARALGDSTDLEGSWYGNDTVWRMTLDLQRILRYGRLDGTLAPSPQRTVVTLTDAIVAGEGDGPLAPTPVDLGMLTLSLNPVAAEWVHALLMGFDPGRIPIVRGGFDVHRFPLVDFGPEDVEAWVDGEPARVEDLSARWGCPFRPPAGWKGHCELEPGRTPSEPSLLGT